MRLTELNKDRGSRKKGSRFGMIQKGKSVGMRKCLGNSEFEVLKILKRR